jgi:hypothetical protein
VVALEHRDPRLIDTTLTTDANGGTVRDVFAALTSGEEFVNSIRGTNVRSRASWEGAELVIESWADMGERKAHFRDHWSLSGDGKTLKMEHRDDDLAGQIAVFERAPEAAGEFESALTEA